MPTVDVVIGTNNWLVDGITLSEMYLVESNIADIISISYRHLRILGRRGRQFFQ